MQKTRMFTPGPTPLLPEAMLPALVTPLNHRKEDFKKLFRELQQQLQQVFETKNEVLLLTCSGSGAMEAAVTNLLAPGEKVLAVVAGKFGERWEELTTRFGAKPVVLRYPYGESVPPQDVARALDENPNVSAVFLQATETSTGALMDIESIGAAVREREGVILVIDAITGLGTTPIRTDAWGLDVVIGGSQKAFMIPPGLAMISLSAKAWARAEKGGMPRYYFDLLKERKNQREGQTAYTPAISLVQALKAALDLISADGVQGLVRNAALQAGATRAAVAAAGCRIFPKIPSDAVTAFTPPEGVDPSKVISLMRNHFGVHLSGGQGSMKGKILRAGHLGYFDFLETLGMIGCLEICLRAAGAGIEPGSAVKEAVSFYEKNGVAS